MNKIPVAKLLKDFSLFFTQSGYSVYLVGGAVRDMLLGRIADDWDVATNATPQEVSTLFHRVIPTGIDHGTVTIPFRGKMIECTTFRCETGYADGRRPDIVSFTATIEEDLSRRDLTINAIAVELPTGNIIDPFDGRTDIKNHLIKTVGNPEERFNEDGLRPLRAVRFSSQLEFAIHPETLAAIPKCLEKTALVSHERIRDEIIKILSSKTPSIALRFMEQVGLLTQIIPELAKCRGVTQRGAHRFDVLDHLFLACDMSISSNLEVRLAALLHDIGKPESKKVDDLGNVTFYNHETISAMMSEKILCRLKFTNKTIKQVTHLIAQHMFHYEPHWSDAAVRRFIVRVGESSIQDLFLLRSADSSAISGKQEPHIPTIEFKERIDTQLSAKNALSLKDLAINGKDLLALGIKSGPITGHILHELFESVLEDPTLNSKDRLIRIVKEIIVQRGIELSSS